MKENSSGQVLAFYSERSRTFYCGTCGRDILLRAKFSHPSAKCHLVHLCAPKPRRASYVRKVRRERSKRSAFAFNDQAANDAALESYYRQCAEEDGTTEDHKRWLKS